MLLRNWRGNFEQILLLLLYSASFIKKVDALILRSFTEISNCKKVIEIKNYFNNFLVHIYLFKVVIKTFVWKYMQHKNK